MGQLVDGRWHDVWYDTSSTGGRFVRSDARFRNWVTADGSPGPSGEGGFRADPGRYHLYVSLACPWAHRTLIYRALKGLEGMIDVSVVHWLMRENGWTFAPGPECTGDRLQGFEFLHQVYTAADARYSGRVTVPVLWDRERRTIVSNESSEIIRMFNAAFDDVTGNRADYYPPPLRAEIDALNERIYAKLNNGVYRAGNAKTQEAYEEGARSVFETLDWLEGRLAERRYLCGDAPTEADWRLFPTLVRFDAAYYFVMKCNLRRLADYPNLHAYTRDLYGMRGIAETVDIAAIKLGYWSNRERNPTGIVPLGPAIDFTAPHDRARLSAKAAE